MKKSLYLLALISVTAPLSTIKAAQEPDPVQNQAEQNQVEQDEDELKQATEARVVAAKGSIGGMLQAMQNMNIAVASKKLELFQKQRELLIAQLTEEGKTQEEIDVEVQALEQEFNQEKDADQQRRVKERADFIQGLKNSVRETIMAIAPHRVEQDPALKKSLNLE